ncbi:MAG TPA: hypothetical protein VF588_19910 [Pyrinomonadaceae bacterium]
MRRRRKWRKASKRDLKKHLRRREAALDVWLRRFLAGYDPARPLDNGEGEGGENFRLLLRLRWLIFTFIYVRLELSPWWGGRRRFLEHFDVDEVRVEGQSVELVGDMVWWAEGPEAAGEWWPPDHEPRRTGVYKVKIRGDLGGGRWVVEPVRVRMSAARVPWRNASYEIEFGRGSTYLKIRGG